VDKHERLQRTIAGEDVDRLPVVAWRHWPGDDQRSADLAASTVAFQNNYDWDFVRVSPFRCYSVTDYGVQTTWQGDGSGDRATEKVPVRRSLDWTELRPLDPIRGELGKFLESVRLIQAELSDVPLVIPIYSPLAQAVSMAADDLAIQNMRTHPDRLRTGLNVITESVLRFIDLLKRIPIAGIVYIVEQADYAVMSWQEYQMFGVPYDLKILESLPDQWWFNTLHLRSNAPMFESLTHYPVHAINWDYVTGRPELDKAWSMFKGALMTGLSNRRHLHFGTPAMIRDVARDAILQMDGRRLILSPGDSAPVSTPLSNFRALREVVDVVQVS